MLKKWVTDKITKRMKRGLSSLSMVAGVLMTFVAIGGLGDLVILQTKFSALSSQTGYMTRVVASQGGISTKKIANFNGRYVTSKDLYTNIQGAMNHAGISDDEWVATINGVILTPATHVPTLDYGKTLPVSLTIDYDWQFTSNFVPSAMKNSRTSTTEAITTHRIRESGFKE